MSDLIYNVPSRLAGAHKGQRLIVRTDDPAELIRNFGEDSLEDIVAVQLLALDAGIEGLAQWGEAVPVDIMMPDPAEQFTSLYRFAKLLDTHPVRVSITVKPGFAKAVKLALALKFQVKLEVGQPDRSMIREISEVLDFYLHKARTALPVEFFQSVFLHFFRQETANLWQIQEEDPGTFRFVADDGEEDISERFGGAGLNALAEPLSGDQTKTKLNKTSECETCEFLDCCGGYFKWPDEEYDCAGIKSVFATIREAASEMKTDLNTYAVSQGEPSI